MFCSHCGAKAANNFCSVCGARITSPETMNQVPNATAAEKSIGPPPLPGNHAGLIASSSHDQTCDDIPLRPQLEQTHTEMGDWEHESRYQLLLYYPEVQDALARYAAQAKKKMSAEEFLSLADKVYKPIPGVSFTTLAKISVPLWKHLGVGVTRNLERSVKMPIGRATVATLCALARQNQTLKSVTDTSTGCVIEATIPSDMWAFDGDLQIVIDRDGEHTHLYITGRIMGSYYDWGKTQKIINSLADDIPAVAAELPHASTPIMLRQAA